MKTTYLKPLLPLRDIVIFPSMVVPLFVGREKSIKALQDVMKSDKSIVLVTQKNSEVDDPTGKELFQYGCLSKVLQLLKLPDGTVKVLVEGEKRVKIIKRGGVKDKIIFNLSPPIFLIKYYFILKVRLLPNQLQLNLDILQQCQKQEPSQGYLDPQRHLQDYFELQLLQLFQQHL